MSLLQEKKCRQQESLCHRLKVRLSPLRRFRQIFVVIVFLTGLLQQITAQAQDQHAIRKTGTMPSIQACTMRVPLETNLMRSVISNCLTP